MFVSRAVSLIFAVCCIVCAMGVIRAEADAMESPGHFVLTQDGTFDSFSAIGKGPWEVRYAQKESDEGRTRPRWRPVPEVDAKSPTHGKHLFMKPIGKGAGTVYIGQRVRIPKQVPVVDLVFDFQTFCPAEKRSGSLDVFLVPVKEWDALSSDPEKAAGLVRGVMYQESVHPNKDDVTEWKRFVAKRARLMSKLRDLAGREVVFAVAWEAWHAGAAEWTRLDNFGFVSPPPSVSASGWPRYIYRGEPARLRVAVTGDDIEGVVLEYRPAASGDADWNISVGRCENPGVWVADVPATATGEPPAVRARAARAHGEAMVSKTHRMELTDRPTHPCVKYNADELARMRERIGKYDWAKKEWETVHASADAALKRNEEPPGEPGGWSHDYTCVHCGAPLRYRDDHPHEHICRKCGKITTGEKPDATWRGIKHHRLTSAAHNMGLAWHMTGDERYARGAIRILKWYADHYADFSVQGRRGKVHWQSLTESSWLTSIAEAADLVFNAMTDEEKRVIETDLIRAGAEHVAAQPCGYSNWRCWYNACLGTAGYFLGDPDLISRAREGEGGFKYMIDKGVLEDGMWYERSIGYHNYSLNALIRHVQADRHAGGDLWRYGRLPMMFTAELRLTFPNLVSPSLNDMGYASGKIGTHYLTYGWAWYRDPVAGGALNVLHRAGATRVRLEDWHVSEPIPENLKYEQPPGQNMSGVGLAVLREGSGDGALCAMLEYGEHGGGHGHPDKLQLLFYGLGRPLCPDLGTARYGSPLYRGWYKTTPGHNTVTIGGKNMKAVTGEFVAFRKEEGWSAATARTDKAYPGYMLTRRILLSGGFLVDVFDVRGGKADTMDWFLRAPGDLSLSIPTASVSEKPISRTYSYLQDLRAATSDKAWQAVWQMPKKGGRLVLDIAGDAGTQASQFMAPGAPGEMWATLRIRRKAANTRFAVVYQPVAPKASPLEVRFDGMAVRVGDRTVSVPSNGETLLEQY